MNISGRNVFLNINPLGDLVMASVIVRALQSMGAIVTMRVPGFALDMARLLDVPVMSNKEEILGADPLVVELGKYLQNDVHFGSLPDDGYVSVYDIDRTHSDGGSFGHLCQWMAVYTAETLGIEPFEVNPTDIQFRMTTNLIMKATEIITQQLPNAGGKPIVLFSVAAGSNNRILPPGVVLAVISQLGDDFCPVLLAPLPNDVPEFEQMDVPKLKCDLVDLPAVLTSVDALVSTDSGPTHIAAAGIQGCVLANGRELEARGGMTIDPKRLIMGVGSSHPLSLVYAGNQFVQVPQGVCPVMPCGAHGYGDPNRTRFEGRQLYFIGQSACIFPEYSETLLAPCMKAVSPEEIVEKVRAAVA